MRCLDGRARTSYTGRCELTYKGEADERPDRALLSHLRCTRAVCFRRARNHELDPPAEDDNGLSGQSVGQPEQTARILVPDLGGRDPPVGPLSTARESGLQAGATMGDDGAGDTRRAGRSGRG